MKEASAPVCVCYWGLYENVSVLVAFGGMGLGSALSFAY